MHLKNQSPNTTTSRRFRFIHSQNLWNRSLQELTQLAVIYLGNKVKRTKDRTEAMPFGYAVGLSFLRPQLDEYGAVLVVLPAFVAVWVLIGDVVDEDGKLLVVEKIAKDTYLLQRHMMEEAKDTYILQCGPTEHNSGN